jgi:hypothetical protein
MQVLTEINAAPMERENLLPCFCYRHIAPTERKKSH